MQSESCEQNNNFTRKSHNYEWLHHLIKLFCICAVIYLTIVHLQFFICLKPYIIVSSSMSPILEIGDLAIVNTAYSLSDLQPDDIIAFRVDINDDGKKEVVVHYLAETVTVLGGHIYLTKRYGVEDYNDWDLWRLRDEDIIGKCTFTLPRLGRVLLFLDSWFGRCVVVVDVIIIFSIIEYLEKTAPKKKKKVKKVKKEKIKRKDREKYKKRNYIFNYYNNCNFK